ncbi:hypothetical protein [Candidatus Poriferisodalis sp.]|uniref:hypothetical protein n=1 Tax=Candidatus Poriferisodalis sp. TaxID=3101277 RepID=UPI003D101F85
MLLGDAGSGKSTEFEMECERLGDEVVYRTARDFVNLEARAEWREKTLFIDGLDEVRAGTADGRPALDEIRKRLDQLGWPSFRISCREADWLGNNDRRNLESATPGGTVAVLRLEPLGAESQRTLLAQYLDGGDVQMFVDESQRHQLSGMLDNPLTLKLLAQAVAQGGGTWPTSRRDASELACHRMAEEHNDEHIAAAEVLLPVEAVLTVAGELGATQLLTGIEGFSLGPADDDSSYVALNGLQPLDLDVSEGQPNLRRWSLGTKLFAATYDSEAGWPRRVPLHRHIAEFLGGRYLARLVEDGLPARRVVALMISPHDGRVVTSLRGLSAWFAAHSPEALDLLIDADPVGIGLYGDVGGLNGSQERRLLQALAAHAAEGPLLRNAWRDRRDTSYRDTTVWAFRSIVDAETIDAVKFLLRASPHDPPGERIREFLLEVLSVADEHQLSLLRELTPQVAAFARDGRCSRHVRLAALDAQLRLTSGGVETRRVLQGLLDDIFAGSVTDPDRQLAGRLLEEIYPDTIRPAEVWEYLGHPSRTRIIGLFEGFWRTGLSEHSSGEQAGELLDSLHNDAARLVPALRTRHFDSVPVDLLAKALIGLGDKVDSERLFSWLSVAGASEPEVMPARSPAAPIIRDWLETRPEVQRSVYLDWLRRRDPNDPLGFRTYDSCLSLHGSMLPSDVGRWCLERAVELAEPEPLVARELLRIAYQALEDPTRNEGLTADVVRETVSDSSELAAFVEALFATVPRDPNVERVLMEHDERAARWEEEKQRRSEEWATGLRSSLAELQGNTFSAPNLHCLALAYMGLYAETDDELAERDRLSEFIGGDADLVEAVLQAFRESITRPGLPSVEETITLHSESKHAWLALPALAGLRLFDDEDPARLDSLVDGLKRQALALLFCVPTGTSSPPSWFERWFEQNPLLVAEVAIRCATDAIRSGDEHPPGLNELDTVGGDEDVKHIFKLRLLKSFPPRGSNAQLRLLDRLLLGVMVCPGTRGLHELIDKKLALARITVAQRTRWLTAAALLFEGPYVSELAEHVERHRSGARHVAEFLHEDHGPRVSGHSRLTASLSSPTLGVLIELLGRAFGPLDRDGLITVDIDAADRIRDMISQLSQMPDPEATEALQRLGNDPELGEWHDVLRWRREEQSAIRRDAEYRNPTVEDVQRTLSGGAPANAADLAALLLDRLDDIADEMRGAVSDPWRPYWNEDSHGRPENPKSENWCRDSLLAALNVRPPQAFEVVREGSYAAGKRADVRASCAGFNVPIEIKREAHRDLWHAMHNQLISQYTTDPATDGYGIYLVLWFGGKKMPTPPSGQRPGTPVELRELLEQSLSIDEARKISVRIIDVTSPGR